MSASQSLGQPSAAAFLAGWDAVPANPTPPISSPPLVESSLPEDVVLTWADLAQEPQELRARELELLGYSTMAARVRMCGWTSSGSGYWTCKQRLCPQCSKRIADRHADALARAIAAMTQPVEVLFTYRSKGLGAPTLRTAITAFRRGLRLLRARAIFACVPAGIGAIEASRSDDGTVWQVHSHMALDIQGSVDEKLLAKAWKKVTAGRGVVQLRKNIYSPTGFADYTTKATTWSPLPGTTKPLYHLEVLKRGFQGRQLVIAWRAKIKASDPV